MSFSFNAALSGLNASSNALNVVGNNIANANTIGFRSGQITFSDVFANRYGARLNGAGNTLQIGDGVQTGAIHTNLAEGNLVESTSPHTWSPPAPGLTIAVEWPTTDDVRVEVLSEDGDPRLAAAIELVSPRNKDRPQSREAFAAKCAEHLRHGCGLVVVDVVTSRRADLQADLFATLGAESQASVSSLSAISYRSIGREAEGQLLAWPASLELGRPLPTIPLWLGAELSVPLDLEASYTATCADLRIRHAG